jgi:hypothetical protein
MRTANSLKVVFRVTSAFGKATVFLTFFLFLNTFELFLTSVTLDMDLDES